MLSVISVLRDWMRFIRSMAEGLMESRLLLRDVEWETPLFCDSVGICSLEYYIDYTYMICFMPLPSLDSHRKLCTHTHTHTHTLSYAWVNHLDNGGWHQNTS